MLMSSFTYILVEFICISCFITAFCCCFITAIFNILLSFVCVYVLVYVCLSVCVLECSVYGCLYTFVCTRLSMSVSGDVDLQRGMNKYDILMQIWYLRSEVVSVSNTAFLDPLSSTRSQHNHSFCFQTSTEILSLSKSLLLNDPSPPAIHMDLFSCFNFFNVVW